MHVGVNAGRLVVGEDENPPAALRKAVIVKRHQVLTPWATFGIDPQVQVNFSNSLSAER